jgi:hypothetical protein
MRIWQVRFLVPVVALLGLAVILVIRQLTAPVGLSDYSVFYLGGKVALQGT